MSERLIFEMLLPIVMLILGWITNAYRNKQKKEHDILDNVQHIVDMQDVQIKRQDSIIERYQNKLDASESRRAHDRESIKKAYNCKVPSEECPVLIHDAQVQEQDRCTTCVYKKQAES